MLKYIEILHHDVLNPIFKDKLERKMNLFLLAIARGRGMG
jgi:hypothetical protein